MYIFVDESGIHKSVDHSTFVFVYITIEDIVYIENRIETIEKDLDIDIFHWAEAPWPVKEKFMQLALRLPFFVKIAVIHNPIKPKKEFERIFSHMIVENNIQKIYIDGKKSKLYEKKLKKILRDKGISVRLLKVVNDKNFPGIRLADMVAGLSRWWFDNKDRGKINIFYKRLKEKTIIILE